MAKATQNVVLSPSRDIPFNKLVLSQSNVRRIKAGVSVEELAEDIARRGLLQSLNVRPVLDEAGGETGKFEIPAGGRRFQALSLLVKQKRLAKTAPIPCIVRDAASEILAEDDSLAENMQRVALHPLDQFRAFVALREKGQGEEAIAAAFFVTPQIVKQRLKLASVAPALLDVYADDGMTLEQLMAFTVSSDHARQEQVWDAIKDSWQKESYQIRRMLTETAVRASDKRAVFVGVDTLDDEAGGPSYPRQYGDVPYAAGVGPVGALPEGHYSPAAAQLEPELTLGVEGQRRALQDLAAGHRGPQLGGAQAGSIAVVVFGTKRLHHLSFLFLCFLGRAWNGSGLSVKTYASAWADICILCGFALYYICMRSKPARRALRTHRLLFWAGRREKQSYGHCCRRYHPHPQKAPLRSIQLRGAAGGHGF